MFAKTLVASAALALAFGTAAFAGPVTKPECVAPAKPGGGFDLTCRVAQAALKDAFGSPVQVTFMPGGIGAVAINVFNTSRANDPNSIVAFSSGSLLNLATGKFGQWTAKDMRWVATAGADFGAVVVREDSPYK
ncbi:tripartite tricarboxylate transporter substrate binding protein, partial [Thioclava sp. BHET1]